MSEVLRDELARVAAALGAADVEFTVERPRDPTHGDFATNLALHLARRLGRSPRELASRIVTELDRDAARVASVEIAGPGFINFRLPEQSLGETFDRILALGSQYGRSFDQVGQPINVEFVSANPTGPLHVGHGRGAALGDAIAALLEWTGHAVTREFYVNDAGVQIARLAESLWARVQQSAGRESPVPESGYHGEYLMRAAELLLADRGRDFADLDPAQGIAESRTIALTVLRAEQDATLAEFGVRFNVVASEQRVYDTGQVDAAIQRLIDAGLTFEEDGALWLRTSAFGDDRDRVLRKSDGTFTYLVPDVAYHLDKFSRGFTQAIDVWGADHHGYIPRMQAALRALDIPASWLEVTLVQLVRVVRGGEEVKMSKRSGDFISLRELYEEVGVDAARYWFLMRRGDTHLTFDIELAKAQTDENPVFYVQMAHARLSGIFRTAQCDIESAHAPIDLTVLGVDDIALLKHAVRFPELVIQAARAREPHRITTWLDELARLTHAWYQRCRVLGVDPAVEQSRLVLARGVRQVFANALTLLGVTAPDRM